MPRYLLVEVDSNITADKLRHRLDSVEGVHTVGMFTKPSQMCSCTNSPPTSVKGAKFGWWLCTICRMPKSGGSQTLWNVLDRKGTPTKYKCLALLVRWVWNEDRVETKLSPREWPGSD